MQATTVAGCFGSSDESRHTLKSYVVNTTTGDIDAIDLTRCVCITHLFNIFPTAAAQQHGVLAPGAPPATARGATPSARRDVEQRVWSAKEQTEFTRKTRQDKFYYKV